MQRHRDGELDDLVRNTIIWIAVVLWLAWGYFVQEPPGDAYTDTVRDAFTIVLAIVIPSISLVVVLAWWSALRNRRERDNKVSGGQGSGGQGGIANER